MIAVEFPGKFSIFQRNKDGADGDAAQHTADEKLRQQGQRSHRLALFGFIARPFGTSLFTLFDRRYGREVKLTIALFLLGGSTASIAFLPDYATIGAWCGTLLCLLRIGQGIALGGTWDGLPALLSLNAPAGQRGWYAMIPQLGAPLGLIVASGLFAYLRSFDRTGTGVVSANRV